MRSLCVSLLALILALGISLSPAQAATHPHYLTSKQFPLLLVHGFASTGAVDCANSAFTTAPSYFTANGWQGPIITVGFYNGDTHCGVNLTSYQSACVNVYPGNVGTVNEDLRHVACELAWYIWDTQSSHTDNVQIWGHSMGGLIVRWMLASLGHGEALPGALYVQDAVTSGTPHGGLLAGTPLIACGGCLQGAEMTMGSSFLTTLQNYGQNPQATDGTDWTMLGSDCDAVPWTSATAMTLGHKVEYHTPCYAHGGYLDDTNAALDASVQWSYGMPPSVANQTSLVWPHSLAEVLLAISSQEW